MKRNLVAPWLPGQWHCCQSICHSKCHAKLHFLRASLIPPNSIHCKPTVLPKPAASSSSVVRGKRILLLMTDLSCPQPGWVWKIPSGGVCFSSLPAPSHCSSALWPPLPCQHCHMGITDLLRVEKSSEKHWIYLFPQCCQAHHNPCPQVSHPQAFWTLPGLMTPPLHSNAFQPFSVTEKHPI